MGFEDGSWIVFYFGKKRWLL